MSAMMLALLLSATAIDDVAERRNYPYDPNTVDARKLPNLVPGLTAGSAFTTARKKILKHGWHPLNLTTTWEASEEPDCGLLDCELHRHGVVEVAGCPTDQPICIFYYRKGNSWLQVMATGETMNALQVYYWASQAPQQVQYAIESCQLGTRPEHVIQVMREHEIAAGNIYAYRYGETSRYFFDTPDASRGQSVHLACAGKKQHALVAYGEFTSNVLQGFVITRSPQTGQLHRLEFAERSPPQWIYIGKHETMAIMPTHGRGEYGDKKYIVYRRANRDGADVDISGSNFLPLSNGFEVAQLPRGGRK